MYILPNFTFMWPCVVTNFFIIKSTRCTNFTNLFWHETLHVSDSSSVHHQEFVTVHSAMVYVIQVCRQLSSRTRTELLESCLQTCLTYTKAECTVKNSWWWTEKLSETCRVSCQNKFVKLVHLVDFIKNKCTLPVSFSSPYFAFLFVPFKLLISDSPLQYFTHSCVKCNN